MSDALLAYVPVLHEGYRRFLSAHGEGLPLYLIGPELYADSRPLAKDIRALDPGLVARAIEAWEICSAVSVLSTACFVSIPDPQGGSGLDFTPGRLCTPTSIAGATLPEVKAHLMNLGTDCRAVA